MVNSTSGDTIEVRGNGPFVVGAIEFWHALTIRAGAGFAPVLTAAPQAVLPYGDLWLADHDLCLQGLWIRCTKSAERILRVAGTAGRLRVANCRFELTTGGVAIECEGACDIRNSELVSPTGATLAIRCVSDSTSNVSNCIFVGHFNLEEFDVKRSADVRFTGNTFLTPNNSAILHAIRPVASADTLLAGPAAQQIHLSTTRNVFSSPHGIYALNQSPRLEPRFNADESETWITRRVKWTETQNLYGLSGPYLRSVIYQTGEVPLKRGKDISGWNRFWGLTATGSSAGVIHFQGGDLVAKARAKPAKLTPDDFRLRPDSAGYRAGEDAKDLGADVDMVGPGPAYERWKKTPEYQRWLKDTGHIAAAATEEPKDFVVIGGKRVEERGFHTLAQAVISASDGDTIEVRGNGPFVTQPNFLRQNSLTIRAASGHRPVIQFERDTSNPELSPIRSRTSLRLEGLELYRSSLGPNENLSYFDAGASLSAANCRFLLPDGFGFCIWTGSHTRRCVLKNCEFRSQGAVTLAGDLWTGAQWVIDNCVQVGGSAIFLHSVQHDPGNASISVTRFTLVGDNAINLPQPVVMNKKSMQRQRAIPLRLSENILDATLLAVHVDACTIPGDSTATLDGVNRADSRSVAWRGQQNAFGAVAPDRERTSCAITQSNVRRAARLAAGRAHEPRGVEAALGIGRKRLDPGLHPICWRRSHRQAGDGPSSDHSRRLPPAAGQCRLPRRPGRQGPRCRRRLGRSRSGVRAVEEDARIPALAQGDGTSEVEHQEAPCDCHRRSLRGGVS